MGKAKNKVDLSGTCLGLGISKLTEAQKLIASTGKKLYSAVKASEGGVVSVDPFILKNILQTIRQNAILENVFTADEVEKVEKWIDLEKDRYCGTFEERLREFCSENGHELDGRFPKYLIDDFLSVNIDSQNGKVKIGDKTINTIMHDDVLAEIVNLIEADNSRPFDGNIFLENLSQSYKRAALVEDCKYGDPIPIKLIFAEMVFASQNKKFFKSPNRANFTEYTISYFQRDIAKVIKHGAYSLKSGERIEFLPTSFSKEEGIPILIGGSVRYIGRIQLRASHGQSR
jgi:hypothetical protein